MSAEEAGAIAGKGGYLFRGDDNFSGGPVGRAFGTHADEADIQNFGDHVLRKESKQTSRYVSFTKEIKIARKFTSAADNRYVAKAAWSALRELDARGIIKVWEPDAVEAALREGPKRLAKQASDVRAAMTRNRELLIEGQIPAGTLERAD
jgi:hypothetical protein